MAIKWLIFERFLKTFVGLMRTDVYMLLEVLIILPVIVKVAATTTSTKRT